MQQLFQFRSQAELSEQQRQIICELRRGDRPLGELRDALGLTYPELDKKLEQLRKFGIVEFYFNPWMVWKLLHDGRSLPKAGERWRHYKGQECSIIDIAVLVINHKALSSFVEPQLVIYSHGVPGAVLLPFVAKHTETGEDYRIEEKEGEIRASLYTGNCPVYLAWARPLSVFMEVLSSPHGHMPNNFYRFDKVLEMRDNV